MLRGDLSNDVYWFLPTLFWAEILFYLINKYIINKVNEIYFAFLVFTIGFAINLNKKSFLYNLKCGR